MRSRPRLHTPGEVRYFTYFLEFPDGERWVDQTPVVHDLEFALANSRFRHMPIEKGKLLRGGECHWKDQNGVTHRVVIERDERVRDWGSRRKKSLIER